jgi:hypothetical protein
VTELHTGERAFEGDHDFYKIFRARNGMVKKLEKVPVMITVTLEFDRPEFPMLATRLAVAKKMSLERYYVQAIQAMVGMQAADQESGTRYLELIEQLGTFTSKP